MNERLGLLFSDDSVLVLAEGTDLSAAWQEAAEHDEGGSAPGTAVVLLQLDVKERYNRRRGQRRRK
jgi:hypothetical protein